MKNKTLLPKNKMVSSQKGWQTGKFARQQTFAFTIPWQFLLLSKLCGEAPQDLLMDFMNNLGFEITGYKDHSQSRQQLLNYFISMGYGQKYFTEDQIKQVFKELDAFSMLWPVNAKKKLITSHAKWIRRYQKWWLRKWYSKDSRKLYIRKK